MPVAPAQMEARMTGPGIGLFGPSFFEREDLPDAVFAEQGVLVRLGRAFAMAGAGLVSAEGRWLIADGDIGLPHLPDLGDRTTGFIGGEDPFYIAVPLAGRPQRQPTWLVLWDDVAPSPALAQARLAEIEGFCAQVSVARLKAAELRNRQMFERAAKTAHIGVWSCSLPDEVLDWSEGVYDLFELPMGEPISRAQTLAMYMPESRMAMQAKRAEAIASLSEFSVDAEIVTGQGRRRWIRITGTVDVHNGRARRVFGIKQDITEEKLLAEETHRLATTDPMTGLANRSRFQARLASPVGALLLVDLDGFKGINDTLGHTAGDACLIEAARRMEMCSGAGALVARIGGDEFAIVIDRPAQARDLAEAIIASLREPVVFEGVKRSITASVGNAYGDGMEADLLYGAADKAMYTAKAGGRNTWREFSASR